MNVEHVYRITDAGWVHCHGHQVQDVPAWPSLKHSALVVLDLDDVPTDVWRFEGKPEYASALIEKRIRTEGLVEGAAHIVIHRLVKVPRGFQAFFSAIPLDFWQRVNQWADEQPDHCLIMAVAGLLSQGVSAGKARLLLSQRRLTCFAQTDAGMVFSSTQALGQGMSVMGSAARVLVTNHSELLTRLGAGAVEWGAFWSTNSTDTNDCLAILEAVLGNAPRTLPAVELSGVGERVQTVLPLLAGQSASQHALNPLLARVAWKAERWVAAITAMTAVVGVGLAGVGILTSQQAQQQHAVSQASRAELSKLQERIQSVSSVDAPKQLLPLADFARQLDEGARHDPVAFLATLKAAAGNDIYIHRVRLELAAQSRQRSFRVDGAVAVGASASMVRWSNQMAAAGWKLKALDPSSPAPGAFSYELVAMATPSGT